MRHRSVRLRPAFVVVATAAAFGAAACDSPMYPGSTRGSRNSPPAPSELPFSNNPPPPPSISEPFSFPQPEFGPTVTLDPPPPALGGASLLISDQTAIATDPDRDRVVLVDLATKAVRTIALQPGDEPGRLVDDGSKRVHVVLDRAGAVATIDLATATILARRPVCAAPLGIARDGADLVVACTGGEIVTLPADPGGTAPAVLARIDRDLRDVVVIGSDLLVSRLRSAEVLRVRRSDGTVLSRAARPAGGNPMNGAPMDPFVGWRLVRSDSSRAILVHQMAQASMVDVEKPQAYGGQNPCGGTVVTALTIFTPSETTSALDVLEQPLVDHAVAAVDIARAHSSGEWALIAAGNAHTAPLQQVMFGSSAMAPACTGAGGLVDPDGQAVAVAYTPTDELVVLTREPSALHIQTNRGAAWQSIALGGASREDTGHAIFHSDTGGGIACVSCHPGGADDGRVWNLSSGLRRTQTLQGTLDGTAPYHWGGDAPGIETFASEVFTKRMGGPGLAEDRVGALRAWLMRLPAAKISPPVDAAAGLRGKQLFESAAVGCTSCHSGPKLTNNESADVGTGGTFQVPSLLGVGLRAPYLHDGRAVSLYDRFTSIGGGDDHGQTSGLTQAELNDLVTYLESL